MTTYRFIGTESYVGETKMSRFGQRFKIDEELAALAQKGGAALLSEEDFNNHSTGTGSNQISKSCWISHPSGIGAIFRRNIVDEILASIPE